jgi:5,10-methylenetetrahydromethanopterin reductase
VERLGFSFAGGPAVPEMVALARRAEQCGFESIWYAETRLAREGMVATAALAAGTERALVGTGIVNVFTRGPVLLAQAFATLAEIAPGRILVGLGAGSPGPLAQQGIAWERPLARLRSSVDTVRRLLAGEEVDGARLEAPPAQSLPLYLAATAPRAVGLAGEVADGVLYNACLPPAYVERRRALLTRDVDVAMKIVVSPDEDGAVARDRARRHLGVYLGAFPAIAAESGLPEERLAAIRAAYVRGGADVAAAAVDDDAVDALSAAGTPAECRARLDAYRAAGVDLPILVPVDGAFEASIGTLGPR